MLHCSPRKVNSQDRRGGGGRTQAHVWPALGPVLSPLHVYRKLSFWVMDKELTCLPRLVWVMTWVTEDH